MDPSEIEVHGLEESAPPDGSQHVMKLDRRVIQDVLSLSLDEAEERATAAEQELLAMGAAPSPKKKHRQKKKTMQPVLATAAGQGCRHAVLPAPARELVELGPQPALVAEARVLSPSEGRRSMSLMRQEHLAEGEYTINCRYSPKRARKQLQSYVSLSASHNGILAIG